VLVFIKQEWKHAFGSGIMQLRFKTHRHIIRCSEQRNTRFEIWTDFVTTWCLLTVISLTCCF